MSKDYKICGICKNFSSNFQEGTTTEDVFREVCLFGKVLGKCCIDNKCYPMFSNEECKLKKEVK